MKPVVLNTESKDYSEEAKQIWLKAGYNYREATWDEIESLPQINEVEILIVRLKKVISSDVLEKFPRLKYVVSATTGHDHLDTSYMNSKGIQLISLRGHEDFLKTIPSTAEHTWALLLSLIRNIPSANEDVKHGQWNRDKFKGYQLAGKKIGIIGLGRIGQMVAQYAKVFGMEIYYYDPFIQNKNYQYISNVEDLLGQADIVTFHIHLENNEGFLDAQKIDKIKRGAYLINTSRGKIWDEKALADALHAGKIKGIATDVLSTEMKDIQKSPLWQAQQKGLNIIITPHIGGATYDAMWATEEFVARKTIEKIKN